MKKKILSLLLGLCVMFSMVIPAQAESGDIVIDGVTYYDVASRNFAESNKAFIKDMLSKDEDIASWWQRLAFSIMKVHGNDTEDSKFRTQMNSVMLNAMGYNIGSTKSYNRSITNDDNTYGVYATGLQNAGSVKAAGSAMESKIFSWYDVEGNRDKSDAVATNKTLEKESGKEETYWMAAGAFKETGTNKKGHYQALGLVFSDFEISTILPEEESAYTIELQTASTNNDVSAADIENLSLITATAEKSLTDRTSVVASSSITGSESYSFSENISVTVEGKVPLLSSVSTTVGFTASQTIETGWGQEKSESHEESSTTRVVVEVPAHTRGLLTQETGITSVTKSYDCPVVLTFTVRIVEYTLDPSDNDADAKTKVLGVFNNDARTDLVQRAIKEKDISGADPNGINWKKMHSNSNYSWVIDETAHLAPMSYAGAKFTVTQESVNCEIMIAPIYPLAHIRVVEGEREYHMNSGETIYMDTIKLEGYNNEGAAYYGFNQEKGHWILTDENGNEVRNSKIASLQTSGGNGATRLIAGNTTGVVYLKYVIDENIYTTADGVVASSESEDGITLDVYTKNEHLQTTAIIPVYVTGKEGINPFEDVYDTDYYCEPVLWAVEEGITDGWTATTFEPNMGCTRGQVVTFLWRAAGEPKAENAENPFTDVAENAYYYDAVLWAVENGITDGWTATTFAPDMTCTRGQIVTFIWRAAGEPEVTAENPFTDVAENAYYYDAVLWAVENGITDGWTPDQFAPEMECTRGQVVTFLYRHYN